MFPVGLSVYPPPPRVAVDGLGDLHQEVLPAADVVRQVEVDLGHLARVRAEAEDHGPLQLVVPRGAVVVRVHQGHVPEDVGRALLALGRQLPGVGRRHLRQGVAPEVQLHGGVGAGQVQREGPGARPFAG